MYLREKQCMQILRHYFNRHLRLLWISDVALSETIDFEDKKGVINKSLKLFDEMEVNVNPTPENNAIKV